MDLSGWIYLLLYPKFTETRHHKYSSSIFSSKTPQRSQRKVMEIRKKPLLQTGCLTAAAFKIPYSLGASVGKGIETTKTF